MENGFVRTATVFFAVLSFVVASCMINDSENYPDFGEQLQKDLAAIDSYLASRNITASKDADGLIRYVIYRDSSTTRPTIDSCVTANYQGLLMSTNQEFDNGQGISFPLSSVIDGWKIGIPLLDVGDSATLYIPSGLAYGIHGFPPEIPANANLIFHVALTKVGSTYKTSDRSCN